jgi:peptidoglycan hydrolase-like protein with peptidoglycan-binding domain
MKKVMVVMGLFLSVAQAFAWNTYNYNDYQVNSYDDYRICAIALTRELRIGSENSEVLTLQDFLHDSGYLYASPNGYFGKATREAVMLFQADHGISRTGVVGPSTRQAINDEICSVYDTYTYSSTYSSRVGLAPVAPTTQIPTTYVSSADPFATTITPTYNTLPVPTFVQQAVQPVITAPVSTIVPSIPAASTQIQATTIVNNPASGYTYGIIPQTASIVIASPVMNAVYNEGETINLIWSAKNLNATAYQIFLENTVTSQSKLVTTVTGNSAAIFLSKELLDAVCVGVCNNNQQGSFKVVIATPITDIAGNTSLFKAGISPITINRPYANFGTVSLTTSKTPVNSNEVFKLYTNIPTGASWNANLYGQYSFRIRAVCPSGVSVSIAGTPCGQEFSLPFTPTALQQEIPAVITNTTWYGQDVTFELIVTNTLGQVIGTSQAIVRVNPMPFSW